MRKSRILIYLLLFLAFLLPGYAFSADGQAVFEAQKCGMCHKPDKKAAAVSLAEIAKAYPDRDDLVKFLKGEDKPKIESERYGMMLPQVSKTSKLSDQERSDLADYILSFKQ